MDFEKDFEQINLALLKNPHSRSYDDLLCIRNFVFKIGWIQNFFSEAVLLGQLNEFCRHLAVENAAKNDVLYEQGGASDRIFFIVKGNVELRVTYKVDLTKDVFEEREKVEARKAEGDCFGLEALDLTTVRTATALVSNGPAIFVTMAKFTLRGITKDFQNSVESSDAFHVSSKAYVLSVLSKRREFRTAHEIENVAKYLKARIPFFMKFTSDQQKELCRIAETVSFPEKKVLFKQGQVGQAFYIVLTGNVDVVKSDANLRDPNDTRAATADEGMGEVVNTMREGETFGEKALESTSSLRTATVVSSERLTELLLIYKEDYYNIVSVIRHRDTMEKIVLLRKNPIFKNADMTLLKAMCSIMESRSYRLDDVLFEEGDRAVDMIFIRVGECRAEITVHSMEERVVDRRPKNYQKSTITRNAPAYNAKDSDLSVTTTTKERTVALGRIGPASLLGPYVALCSNANEEVYHSEKVVACTLLQTYVIWKNDFFCSIPETQRAALRGLIQSAPQYILPTLWDTEPQKVGERQWKEAQAWKKFQKEVSRRKPGADILLKARSLDNMHLMTGKRDELDDTSGVCAKSQSRKLPNLTFETPEAIAAAKAKQMQELGIGMTKAFVDSPLVSESIHQSMQHKLLRDARILAASQPILRRCYNAEKQDLDHATAASFKAAHSKHRFGSRPSSRPYKMSDDGSFEIDPLVATSHFPIIVHPFTLIHIHRNLSKEPPGGGMGGRRFMKCYFRLCGCLKTLSEAKDSAFQQTKHAFLNNLQKSSGVIHEASPFSWSPFTSFENLDVSNTDFYLIYCRASPIEFASFSPDMNMLQTSFPGEVKPTGQQFACVRFAKLKSIVRERVESILTHPKYLQELAILEEVAAVSFTLNDCLRHLLQNTAEGQRLRAERQPKLSAPPEATQSAAESSYPCSNRRSSISDDHHHTAHHNYHHHHHGNHVNDAKSSVGTTGSGSEGMRHYFIVPLFEWILVSDNELEQMSLANIIFNSSEEELVQLTKVAPEQKVDPIANPSSRRRPHSRPITASSTNDNDDEFSTQVEMSSEEISRNKAALKNAFSEVGLLKEKLEEDIGSKTEKINVIDFGKDTSHNPAVKMLETEVERQDFKLMISTFTKQRQETLKDGLSAASEASSSPTFGTNLTKLIQNVKPASTSDLFQAYNLPSNGSLVTHRSETAIHINHEEELRQRQEKIEATRAAARIRSAALQMNDEFCFAELYTPQLPRVGNLNKLVSSVLLPGEDINDLWSETKLNDRSRQLRRQLEEKIITDNIVLRHNPSVKDGIDNRRVDSHVVLLDVLTTLPKKVGAAREASRHTPATKSPSRSCDFSHTSLSFGPQESIANSTSGSQGRKSHATSTAHSSHNTRKTAEKVSLASKLDALRSSLDESIAKS